MPKAGDLGIDIELVGLAIDIQCNHVPSSFRADSAARHPNFHQIDEFTVRNRNRLTASARVPTPQHERLALHMFNERLQRPVAIEFWVLEHPAQIADRHPCQSIETGASCQ
jgi:hypothetical protein